ncbi:nitrogenase component 1 type Oxidoreductase family protein [[Clostridium] bifermentans ATCC 638]|uniref:Nitrogenase component 1 type Oxidoreductase family protein n=1 Tax=Paraclostridium bifermentans ATCC 638 = DSM 14991 TaxID=1233171 RepID=T4VEK8_PARBF|nr:nitrogenase component 1 [Paraclostridium bifermentans]EQK42139.1 nitrogenase component 1 type Oxidoreductase family protein [[Clostridium] bifermentans ATCC 638] [Paraclostridium bifermentans ATCC 638 = DSM 14991]RIZ58894.1 oxalate:formate antiporter [Paraclostridium bifermentans]UAG19002.1 nitrogenase component 1 [Paraclostridium bifermentans]
MYSLDVLNKLDEINEDKDIKSLSHAIFPGTHCPLFGVMLTASYIKNMPVLVVGTSECTYYTKNFAYHRQKGKDSVYSLALKEKDVVFGAQVKVEKAIKQIVEIEEPDAIMIVTTCVPELIGEDYSSIEYSLSDEINIPIFVVNTEHFKCNSHIPGMTRALRSLGNAMTKPKYSEGVNMLGHRQSDVEKTELVNLLKSQGIKINTVIPSKCDIEDIKNASNVKLNIVTDMIAIDLAKYMKEKFGIDYIYFDKHMSKNIIFENYHKLSKILDIDFNKQLSEQRKEYDELFLKLSEILKGKKLIYGNTPMMAFETVDFLSDLGAIPIFVQVRELYEQDKIFKSNLIEKGFNPYVSRIANIAPLRHLYDSIGADLYIGHENPMLLREKGLMQITMDSHAQKIGYELPIAMMKDLIKLFEMKNNKMGGMMHGSL